MWVKGAKTLEQIIKQIIEADRKARSNVEKARKHKEDQLALLQEDKKDVEKTLIQRAEKRMNYIDQIAKNQIEEEKMSIEQRFKQDMKNIEDFFSANSQNLEDLIFRHCLDGGESSA